MSLKAVAPISASGGEPGANFGGSNFYLGRNDMTAKHTFFRKLALWCCVCLGSLVIVWFLWITLSLVYYGEKGRRRFAALDAVRGSAPYVSDFVRLFPGASVSYHYFDGNDVPGYDVEVDLHARYQFDMRLPVNFDSHRSKVIGYGRPVFYLGEIASQNGRETTFNPVGARQFGSAEWQKVLEHNGDFSAIGYIMVTNIPIAGYKDRNAKP